MRFSIIVVLSILGMAFAAPVHAQKGPVIDTGEGLKFEKPDGWVDAGKKKGTVAALRAAGDESSAIEFRFARMSKSKSGAYFHSFHASLVKAGLQKAGERETKAYGKLKGDLTEYSAAKKKDEGMSIFVFQFYRGDAAWLVVGMFNGEERDPYFRAYESLLENVEVE